MIIVVGLILGVLICAAYLIYWGIKMKDFQLIVLCTVVAAILIGAIGGTAWLVMS